MKITRQTQDQTNCRPEDLWRNRVCWSERERGRGGGETTGRGEKVNERERSKECFCEPFMLTLAYFISGGVWRINTVNVGINKNLGSYV